MPMTDPETVVRLELKIAYLEKAQHEMSDLLYAQRRELDRLAAQLTALRDQLHNDDAGIAKFDPDSDRPPHF